jgi:hypothetical protein
MLRPDGVPGSGDVSDEASLRRLAGSPAAATSRKILPTLDSHAACFAALSRMAVVAVGRADGRLDVAARAGGPGFARAASASELWIADTIEGRLGASFEAAFPHDGVGVLLLVPGICETLRLNGAAARVREPAALAEVFGAEAPDAALRVDVRETYFHCAKSLVRSRLWPASTDAPVPEGDFSFSLRTRTIDAPIRAWLARSPFALLATRDADGRADVSPRGDPPGFVRVLDARTLLLPDRPGNRLFDSFRNVLAQPEVALLALVPGERAALRVTGRGRLTGDPALLVDSAVQERAPRLGLRIEVDSIALERRPEPFAASGFWNPAEHAARDAFPSLGRVFADQLGPGGLRGRVQGRVIDAALRRDARRNLY